MTTRFLYWIRLDIRSHHFFFRKYEKRVLLTTLLQLIKSVSITIIYLITSFSYKLGHKIVRNIGMQSVSKNWDSCKEVAEGRRGESIKFLFLPKMGLVDRQASTEKKMVVNYEQLLRAVFSCFRGQFFFFLHCSVCTKKLLKIKVFIFLIWK